MCVTSGDGRDDLHATRVDEGFGPVVTDTAAPAFRGALKHTNNTGELTACIEALTWLLEDGATRPVQILLRPDSEYVMGLVTGRTSATNNRALVNTAPLRSREAPSRSNEWCEAVAKVVRKKS